MALLPIVETIIVEANQLQRGESVGDLASLGNAMDVDANNATKSMVDNDDNDDDGDVDDDADNAGNDEGDASSSVDIAASGGVGGQRKDSRAAQIRMMLERVASASVRGNAKLVQSVTRVLPFLTYGR